MQLNCQNNKSFLSAKEEQEAIKSLASAIFKLIFSLIMHNNHTFKISLIYYICLIEFRFLKICQIKYVSINTTELNQSINYFNSEFEALLAFKLSGIRFF